MINDWSEKQQMLRKEWKYFSFFRIFDETFILLMHDLPVERWRLLLPSKVVKECCRVAVLFSLFKGQRFWITLVINLWLLLGWNWTTMHETSGRTLFSLLKRAFFFPYLKTPRGKKITKQKNVPSTIELFKSCKNNVT